MLAVATVERAPFSRGYVRAVGCTLIAFGRGFFEIAVGATLLALCALLEQRIGDAFFGLRHDQRMARLFAGDQRLRHVA